MVLQIAPDGIAMLGRQRERYRSAPVVADDEKLFLTQYIMGQPPDVVRNRLLVLTRHGVRAVAETPQIGCYHAVAMRKSRHDARHMYHVCGQPWIRTTAGPWPAVT